jgi:hypothetical protein
LACLGKAQRALNRAHDHRAEIEGLLADPWMQRYLPESFLDWADCQLRKDRFYLFSKDEHRIVAEVIEEMKPWQFRRLFSQRIGCSRGALQIRL